MAEGMSDDKLLGMIRSYLRGMGLNKTVNALEEEAEAKDVRLQPDSKDVPDFLLKLVRWGEMYCNQEGVLVDAVEDVAEENQATPNKVQSGQSDDNDAQKPKRDEDNDHAVLDELGLDSDDDVELVVEEAASPRKPSQTQNKVDYSPGNGRGAKKMRGTSQRCGFRDSGSELKADCPAEEKGHPGALGEKGGGARSISREAEPCISARSRFDGTLGGQMERDSSREDMDRLPERERARGGFSDAAADEKRERNVHMTKSDPRDAARSGSPSDTGGKDTAPRTRVCSSEHPAASDSSERSVKDPPLHHGRDGREGVLGLSKVPRDFLDAAGIVTKDVSRGLRDSNTYSRDSTHPHTKSWMLAEDASRDCKEGPDSSRGGLHLESREVKRHELDCGVSKSGYDRVGGLTRDGRRGSTEGESCEGVPQFGSRDSKEGQRDRRDSNSSRGDSYHNSVHPVREIHGDEKAGGRRDLAPPSHNRDAPRAGAKGSRSPRRTYVSEALLPAGAGSLRSAGLHSKMYPAGGLGTLSSVPPLALPKDRDGYNPGREHERRDGRRANDRDHAGGEDRGRAHGRNHPSGHDRGRLSDRDPMGTEDRGRAAGRDHSRDERDRGNGGRDGGGNVTRDHDQGRRDTSSRSGIHFSAIPPPPPPQSSSSNPDQRDDRRPAHTFSAPGDGRGASGRLRGGIPPPPPVHDRRESDAKIAADRDFERRRDRDRELDREDDRKRAAAKELERKGNVQDPRHGRGSIASRSADKAREQIGEGKDGRMRSLEGDGAERGEKERQGVYPFAAQDDRERGARVVMKEPGGRGGEDVEDVAVDLRKHLSRKRGVSSDVSDLQDSARADDPSSVSRKRGWLSEAGEVHDSPDADASSPVVSQQGRHTGSFKSGDARNGAIPEEGLLSSAARRDRAHSDVDAVLPRDAKRSRQSENGSSGHAETSKDPGGLGKESRRRGGRRGGGGGGGRNRGRR